VPTEAKGEDTMNLLNREQANKVELLLLRGMSDFDIATKVCGSDDDPELYLEAVSAERERMDRSTAA
jgi:hypothetical protein